MEINKIHLGNAYELIKQLPDKSIDLVYTDIPYKYTNMGAGGGFLKDSSRQAYYKVVNQMSAGIDYGILDQICRVCKKIYCYIWCSKEQIPELLNYFINKNCIYDILVWVKTNPTPFTQETWLPDLEYCLMFREHGTHLWGSYETKHKWYISPKNKTDKDNYLHPTIKPLDCVKNHLMNSSKPGDIVLDPFMGSGTTAVACRDTGRNYIGYEINEKYHKIATNRLQNIDAYGQERLF